MANRVDLHLTYANENLIGGHDDLRQTQRMAAGSVSAAYHSLQWISIPK